MEPDRAILELVVGQRRQVRLEVKFQTASLLKALWLANIAKGTMSIETDKEIPPGTRVAVALLVPGKEIELAARVEQQTRHKSGKGFFLMVRFDALEDHQRKAIEDVIGTIKEFKGGPSSKARRPDEDTDIDLGEE